MPNVFQQLNDKRMGEHPLNEGTIEKNILRQADTFNTFGKVVELFIPNALSAALEIIGSSEKTGEQKSTASQRPDLMPDWRKPVEGLPQAPKDGILGRFRPTEGRRF